MAAMIVITCPECKKQLKGPAELQGKRVRCKSCGQVFAVHASPPAKPAAEQAKTATSSAKPKTTAPDRAPSEEEKEKNPYHLSEISQSNRCPQCAAQLESPDAIVCLNCGYNSLTRQRLTTTRTYAHTPLDWALWLAPGILCALATLSLIGLIVFLLIPAGLQRAAGDAWWGHFSIQIYGSALAAGVAWITAKYAFRRLVRNFRPPEKFKRAIDA
jgi:DNA-directed RNA polymerase subunit RPC12/RpoP